MNITSEIRAYILSQGAHKVGFSPVDRFAGAPIGHRPNDLLSQARSVISFGVRLLDSIVDYTDYLSNSMSRFNKETRPDFLISNIYLEMGHFVQDRVINMIATKTALKLEDEYGFRAMPIPATNSRLDLDLSNYFGIFSHRHAAVRAGLGEFGLSNLVLTPEFGPRIRLGTIITEAEFDYDPMISEKICLRDSCMKCLDVCKYHAITLKDDVNMDEVFLDTPAITDPKRCIVKPTEYRFLFSCYGCGFYGSCLRVCPIRPKVRTKVATL
jgi:epoxyqueuosine reductase QueG